MGPHDGGEPARHLAREPRRDPADEEAALRQDHQHQLGHGPEGLGVAHPLRHLQGRHPRLHQDPRDGGRQGQHLRQLHRARQHPFRGEPRRRAPEISPGRGSDPRAAAPADAGGSRRGARLLCFARQGFQYRADGRSGRRRVHALILAVLLSLAGAAAAQGTLMLYTTTPEEYMRRLTVDFEKQHAIKVNIWRARSEAISQRVISEARAGSHVVDVIQSIAPSVEGLPRERLLEAVKSPAARKRIPGAAPAHGEWAATLIYVFVQAYNTGKLRRQDLPRSYAELLEPKWKGILAIESSDHQWTDACTRGMGDG